MGAVRIAIARPDQAHLFARIDPDVFDGPVAPALLAEFLADKRHHIAVAHAGDLLIGMCSGVHYVHPDKPAQMWINEVSVASTHRRQGFGAALVRALLAEARVHGCHEAWVAADTRPGVHEFYRALGGEQSGTDHAVFSWPLNAESDRPQPT